MASLDRLVEILKAAGEGTRLRLLALLAQGELSVKDLTLILGQSQPRVSRHLKLLAEAGLVARAAEGSWAYYRMGDAQGQTDLARRLVAQIDQQDIQIRADLEKRAEIQRGHRKQADLYFSRIAESWDKIRSLHVPESEVESAILAAAGDIPVDHFVDFGTGTGRMLELLCERYRRGTGLDSSKEMIAIARAKLAAASIGHAHAQLADIAHLDAGLPAADLIMIHQVLHYFDDPGAILAQAAQVLARHGRIIVVDFAPHRLEFLRSEHAHRRLGLSRDQMGDWARASGLEIARFDAFPNKESGEDLTVCLWALCRAIPNEERP